MIKTVEDFLYNVKKDYKALLFRTFVNMPYYQINKFFLFFILLSLLTAQTFHGQVKNSGNDSVKVYQRIENYGKKNNFNKTIYKLLFKSKRKTAPTKADKRKKDLLKKSFDKSEGKIIRNIDIVTLDPFGFNVDDNQNRAEKGVEKFGNKMHFKTRVWTIHNLLLFKKNEPLDSLIAKESERLIRKQRFIRSVVIKPVAIEGSKDSVDISVRVLDSWTIVPDFSVWSSRVNYGIKEKNFMGLGHTFQNDFVNRFDTGDQSYLGRYTIPNFKNTYINATVTYENSLNNNTRKSARIERRFYSPLARLAGGIFFENSAFVDSLPNTALLFEKQNFKSEIQEYWLGHSFRIFKGNDIDFRSTNLVTTIGFNNINYLKAPTETFDASNFFSSEKTVLTSIGITTQKFAQDKYLYNFGIIEDVSYGQVYSITAGVRDKNFEKKMYLGGRFSYGDYYNFGFLGVNTEWGSFFNSGTTDETTFRLEINYFSNLQQLGNWKLRQFIKTTYVMGNNRAPIIKDRVVFSQTDGLSGFENPLLNGTQKFTTSFQTQTYVPGNWHGFHFSPFYNMTFGLIHGDTNEFTSKKIYSKFSVGIVINNDYLVFDNFQLSFSYFPIIPFEGTNIFKSNTFNNNDLALPEYEIGQPRIVPYK